MLLGGHIFADTVVFLAVVDAQPQQIRPAVVAAGVDEAARRQDQIHVAIRVDDRLGRRGHFLGQSSTVGGVDGGTAAAGGVEEGGPRCAHAVDPLVREYRRAV